MKKILMTFAMLATVMGSMAQGGNEQLESIYQKFTFNLFGNIAGSDDNSVILSPLSARVVLSMIQNGAAGNTLAEITEAMGTSGYSLDEVNEYNKWLTGQLTYRPEYTYDPDRGLSEDESRDDFDIKYPICEFANGLWTSADKTIYDDFAQKIKTYYDAGVGTADFGSQEDIDAINSWVNDHTHGLIPSILQEPNAEISLLLANALYFKGSWNVPFKAYNTKQALFSPASGDIHTADMMTCNDYFSHTSTSKFSTVTLGYGTGDFSMTVFLPVNAGVMPALTYDDWAVAAIGMATTEEGRPLHLELPKFTIDGKYDLVQAMRDMGMNDAFDYRHADFSNLSPSSTSIDKSYQLGKIKVDEKGTEAAAVSVIESFWGGGIYDDECDNFIIDRPFYFTIEHNPTHTVLFVGRMNDVDVSSKAPDGISAIGDDSKRHDGQMYDLQGRRLKEAPARGLYIKDGKKFY